MYNNLYVTNFDSYREDEDEDVKENSLYPLKNDGDFINLVRRDKISRQLENFSASEMLKIIQDRHEQDDEEINEQEQEQNQKDKALNEIKNLENKDSANKSTTKNTNKNLEIKLIEPSIEPENKLLCNKRRKASFDSSNEKNNENDQNKKEDIKVTSKTEKPKEKNVIKNESSLVPDIKKFHTLFNIYFKYLVEKGNSFNVSVFGEKEGPNGYYISRNFTQSNLGAKAHSEKLNEKITKFIQENKLKKLKEKKDEKILKILNFTARELIINFYSYIFENSDYFKENDTIKKINENFIRIRKYPLIGCENDSEDYKIGYFKYFFLNKEKFY